MKNKIYKGMSKIGVLTVLATALLATPVLAQTGDIWNGSTDVGSVSSVILHPDQFLDLLAHLSNYTYEVAGVGYDVVAADKVFTDNPTLTQAQVWAKITATLTGTPVSQNSNITSVSAVNITTVTATLSSVPTVTPVLTDFVVKRSIGGATATIITPTLVMNGAVAKFTVPLVAATTSNQSVVYSVTYKGITKSSTAFVIPAAVNANVSTAAQLATALANSSVNVITLTASITASPTVSRPLTINFGANTLTGNLAFNYAGTGTSILNGTAGTRITGNLTVNTPKASFINGIKVSGAVNVVNVEPGTWTESADGNTLTITDSDGGSITVTGNPGSVTVTESATGGITLTVNPGATVTNITSSAQMNIVVSAGATVTNITAAAGSGGSTITNNGTTGTVTANVPTTITVGTGGTANNIITAAGAGGTTITNNGTAGTIIANVPTNVTVAAGATVTTFTAEAGATGSTFTNNGTTGTVTADVPINLVANVPPANTVTEGTGSVAVTGTGAGSVAITGTGAGTGAGGGTSTGGGGGSTTTSLAVNSITAQMTGIANITKSQTGSNSFNFDLTGNLDSVHLTGLNVDSNGTGPSLVISSVNANGINFLGSTPITATLNAGSVTTASLLGLSDPNSANGVSLGTLRLVFGSGPITIVGHLTQSGNYTNSPDVTVTITLGASVPGAASATTSISNQYMTLTKTGSVITVSILSPSTTIATLNASGNFDFANVLSAMLGGNVSSSSSVISAVITALGNSTTFNDITLSQLIGKTIHFGSAPSVYTVIFQ